MAENRDSILNTLYKVRSYLSKMASIENRQWEINEQLLVTLQESALIETEGMGKVKLRIISVCITLLLFFCSLSCLMGNPSDLIVVIAVAGIGLAAWKLEPMLKKAAKTVKIIAFGFLALYSLQLASVALSGLMSGGIDTILVIIMAVLSIGIFKLVMMAVERINQAIEAKNEKIRQKNVEIMEQNQPLYAEFNQLTKQYGAVQAELGQFCAAVAFPRDYVFLAAVNFFISAVENRRADSFKEAVNLYEQAKERQAAREAQRRMEALAQEQNALIAQGNAINYQNGMMLEQMIENQRQIAASQQYTNQLLSNGVTLYVKRLY